LVSEKARPAPVAAAIARSFIRFFEGDAEGAVYYTAIPRIETLTRELVVALDFPTYQTQRVTRPGPVPRTGDITVQVPPP